MKILRHKTKVIKIGNIKIGANFPIAIQSMAKTRTADVAGTVRQIKDLEDAGSEIVRLAVRDSMDALALKEIKRSVRIPIVADIHFNWHLAIEAIDSGVDKIRLNPGNIYKKEQLREIARAAKINRIPIRVGVNSGSLKEISATKRGGFTKNYGEKDMADAMVKQALDYIKILEGFKFYDIVVSLKSSNIFDTIEAYRKIAGLCDYPLHLGVTASGPSDLGRVKSSVAIGVLLLEGIGDTIRVSLTDKPEEEVRIAKEILFATGLRNFGLEIISCPTCGRCEVDLVNIVNNLEKEIFNLNSRLSTKALKVAVMGCIVNGPGEAKAADIGVAFGKKRAVIIRDNKVLRVSNEKNIIRDLIKEMRAIWT